LRQGFARTRLPLRPDHHGAAPPVVDVGRRYALTVELHRADVDRPHLYLEAGIYEVGRFENGVDLLTSNRHLRDVLRAKGYRVTYDEFAGGHSDLNWRTGFAKGLLALVGR
jgi:enterochelin esterase family protein